MTYPAFTNTLPFIIINYRSYNALYLYAITSVVQESVIVLPSSGHTLDLPVQKNIE